MKNNIFFSCLMLLCISCGEDTDDNQQGYIPVSATLNTPTIFNTLLPPPEIPADNPLTEEGIALGRKLFYERALSANNTLACAGCHKPPEGFSDQRTLSIGITGETGLRNSMPLINLAWNTRNAFNWDGSAQSIEEQILGPITNPLEMNNTWENVVATLSVDATYVLEFEQAFGSTTISKEFVTKAIAQFIRTIVSGDSKFDRHLRNEATLSPLETEGPSNPLWTDNEFHNNGLDEDFSDLGLGQVTGDPNQFGLFKSGSLRNLAYTAPFMHDGRFATIEEVINHYSEGLVFSETIDPLMKSVAQGGVQLSPNDKEALKAFLLSLSEPGLATNPDYQNPN
jgi:cytochrome c peroxidase